jgi:hypothetical protein
MRTRARLWSAVLLIMALAFALSASAGSNSTSFSVGATVVGSCTIAPQRLGTRPGCAPSSVTVPRPTIRLLHDPTTNLRTVTVEF